MDQIILSNQTSTLVSSNQDRIGGIYPIWLNNGDVIVCIRQGHKLIGYKYVASTATWLYIWDETVFSQHGRYSVDRYPWLVADKLLPDKNLVMLRHPDGIRFYQLNQIKAGLDLLKEDGNFHEVFTYTFLWGRFYPNADWVGVMTRNARGKVEFYAATPDSFNPDEPDPLFPLQSESLFAPSWSSAGTDFFVTKLLRNNETEIIGLRTAQGLEFYQFNTDYLLTRVTSTSQIAKPVENSSTKDHIFFADLTHQMYKDILHLNNSGLFVYKYDSGKNDYIFLHRNMQFTRPYGWSPLYSDSIKLADLNSDGRDDLLFTGPNGLTAFSFDTIDNNWKTLLEPERLSGSERYATVVGTLPAIPPAIFEPSIFTQDSDGKLQWAKVVKAPKASITTAAPQIITTSERSTTIQFPNQTPQLNKALIPENITRAFVSEKPVLRWAEQLDHNLLKKAVDTASGQVRLNVPLIDISRTTGWGLQLDLFYNSQAVTTDLFGLGWSLTLAQDYIFVDYQGSIYPGDPRYYLMMQGRPWRLKLIKNKRGIQNFQLAEADGKVQITIEYHQSDQRWIIDGTTEQAIYGKADRNTDKDALQWSLGWPNWRGPGYDTAQQQPFIAAWYLNARFDKDNQRTLYYSYEKDNAVIEGGKAYTFALRLKTISDGQLVQLVFDYAPKTNAEYTSPDPIDDRGNIVFPVPLAQSHYLQGYRITTAFYTQTLKFVYQINDEKRLLTAIQQQLPSHTESVLEFSYQTLLEKQVLKSCTLLPHELRIDFSYEALTLPAPTIVHNNVLSYPIRERAKIAYGSDYAVIAYRDLDPTAGKVILRIMNREMTQIIIDCSTDIKLSCPTTQSEIKNYALHAYHDSFAVFIESDEKRTLYIFNRHKQTWSAEPHNVYSFSKDALVRFSETVIAAAEPNEYNLKLFKRTDNNSDWNATNIAIPRTIKLLALHNQLVVAYDDYQLWLFYNESGWQKKILEWKLSGLASMSHATVNSFHLSPKMQHQLLTALDQNGLQILNNFVVLSALQESNAQISSLVHLFLLDSQYNVGEKRSFNVQRENIYQISRESKTADGKMIYHLGYVKEGGHFKVKFTNISGKTINDIRNKKIRQDKIEEQIKQANQNREFQKSAEEYFLLDWNLYPVQISQNGVYVGNDTLLRITGTGWEKELLPTVQTIHLGKHFVLESDNDNKSLFKLYKQDNNKNKLGRPVVELPLHSPGQLINRYPAYIAYHPKPNLVKLLTFKDDQTLGQLHTFSNEQILPESDWQNLITVVDASSSTIIHAEPKECLVRPASTLISSKPRLFVNQMKLTNGDVQQLTGYQRSYNSNRQELTYSETVTVVPGDNKSLHGWYEATRSYHVNSGNITKTEGWFNANGQQALTPAESETKSAEQAQPAATSSESNPMLLLDRGGKLLISDFSPYSLADEVGAYYGFESYESNQIGSLIANNSAKNWRINEAKIIKGHFALTGESYLQLHSSIADNPSFLEGEFQPHNQDNTYLAAGWIRCGTPLTLNTPVSYLKAIIRTRDGHEIIGLLAQVKHQVGSWSYLELPIDFRIIKQIYQDYVTYYTTARDGSTMLPSLENARFRITLRVEAPTNQMIDLDHIRFSPLTHDFQATVYHPLTGKPTETIQANGLITKIIYNHLQQEIANIDEDGQLKRFSSTSKTGKLVPTPQGHIANTKASVLTFEPDQGFYENFDSHAWLSRWKLDNPVAWNIAPGQLWHKSPGKHRIEAGENLFDSTSVAIRFYFALQTSGASLSLNWQNVGNFKFTRQSDNYTNLILPNDHSITKLPSAGELIIMLEQYYAWLWLDGVLLLDQALPRAETSELTKSSFSLEAQGKTLVEDCLIMNHPQVKVEYYDEFGEKSQVLDLEDEQTVQVKEILYDELGREAITTKTTRVKRNENQPLLTYRSNFVINKNTNDPRSIWFTGKLQGEVNHLNPTDQGVAYMRTEYAPNPLNQEKSLGLPGPDFSITGRHATKISQHSNIAFLDNQFPINQGYRQEVEHTPNGSSRIAVFDRNNNQVAKYIRVSSYNHLLSTYEYDTENRLIKILPPLYHETIDTSRKLTAWQAGEKHLTPEEKEWQKALGTHFVYDEYGRLKSKITPDTGRTEYLYNAAGQMRFMVSLNSANQPQKVVYFDHDANGQLDRTGHLDQPLSINVLRQHLENKYLPYARDYQKINYADNHLNPLLRGRFKHFITYNNGELIAEKLRFNSQEQVIAKSTITESGQDESDQLADIKKQYLNNKVYTLTYPINFDGQPLNLVHSYNRLGQLIGLGTPNNPTRYASFNYHATGQLASEQHQPDTSHSFTRSYYYNSPGFLKQISDPYLTEEITYTEKGYGQAGYGDGMVMQTAFNSTWPAGADRRWFQVEEDDLKESYSRVCIEALKRTGYLNNNGKPIKLYVRNAETALPLICDGQTGRNIAKLIAKKQIPSYYGHNYAYGNHQELVKAKYFTDDTESLIEPLQIDSFAKDISSLTYQQSQHVWQLLTSSGYIITDQQSNDPATAIGKRGKSFFRDMELYYDLSALNSNYILYVEPIQRLIISAIGKQRTLSLTDFEEVFLHWQGLNHRSPRNIYNWQKKIANQIGQMLLDKGYLPTHRSAFTEALDKNFTTVLYLYAALIPEIVQVLSKHFAYALGETAFDVESYKIDANGNHHLFYTGFDRYELAYHNATNKIQNVKLNSLSLSESDGTFAMTHDEQGNVIQALHKNIQHIEYHPVSQRATNIKLIDGCTLRFYYDAQGERVLKRVFNAEGKISRETYYLRDEQGRVLTDQQTRYLPESTEKIITAYLYGPRGLLGFIRNNSFYSITTDHTGSVRLVIRNGQVVAAYDYLPYGQLMRSYGSDPQAHIMYRYTGQEWDEETDLYNYHARLYDPSIGRFFQPDPKAQYFSPYKYAGNSPISVIDPDGEFAILLTCVILGAVAGAYLGGAAVNNRWNPADWDFSDSGTWLGIVGGGIAGGLLPVGFGASVATVGVGSTVFLGAGGGYLMTAAANQNWNPLIWKWDRPGTWSAMFQGFGAGSGIVGGIGLAHNFANTGKALATLSKLLNVKRDIIKALFLTVSYTAGGGISFGTGVIANDGNFAFWQWDWANPATWSALVDGFDTGMGWPQNFIEISRGFGKLSKNPQQFGNLLGKGASKKQALKAILKNPKHPLYKVTLSIVMVYFMGSSANGELDITKWNLASFSTYEGVLNGVFFGKDTSNMLKFARSSRSKQPSKALTRFNKNIVNNWSRKFGHMLDNIQIFRKGLEYKQLMKQSFDLNTIWRSKLIDKPVSLVRDVENFFKKGVDKWKSGENKPPEVLRRLIQNEADQKVQSSSRKLIEWQTETGELAKKQKEIFPDQEAEFLNCRRAAKRRKRADRTSSKSFRLEGIEESLDAKFRPIIKATVSINGEEAVEKTLQEVYTYIEENHSEMMKPDKQKFVTEHQKLVENGYALVGYHGTNEIAALSIMLNGFKPSTNFEPSKSHWRGVYAAENLELALEGYAKSLNFKTMRDEYKHSRVLAVYSKKEDIEDIGISHDCIVKQFGNADDKLPRPGPGFWLNRDSQVIIAGRDTVHQQNEMVIKQNIELKAEVLPIITVDDFQAVRDFFKLQESARKVIDDTEKLLPPLESITTVEDSKLTGVSQNNKEIIKDILMLKDVIRNGINDVNSNNIKRILQLNVISDDDMQYVRDYFFRQNNLFNAVEDFKAIKDVLKLKNLPNNDNNNNANNADNSNGNNDVARADASELIKLPNLSEDGFKGIKHYFLANKNLIYSAEEFKIIREVFSKEDFANKDSVKDMKNLLSSEKFTDNAFGKSVTDVLKLREDILNNDLTKKLTAIREFTGKEDSVNENDVKEMKKLLSLDNFTKNDFKTVINYFMANKNSLLNAIEDFKAIKDVFKLIHSSDNALTDAKGLLKSPDLSEAGFRAVKDYFLAKENNLFNAVEDFKAIREYLGTEDFGNKDAVKVMKTLLSSENVPNEVFNKAIKDVFELKKMSSNNLQIPLENALHHALKDVRDGGAKVSYYCAARQKRSIKPKEEHEEINILDTQGNQDILNSGKIDPSRQTNIFAHIATSSASSNHLKKFWPIILTKKAITAILSVLPIGWLDTKTEKIQNMGSISPDYLAQTSISVEEHQFTSPPYGESGTEGSSTILEMGDQWLNNTDMNGLLSWGVLLARKWTGRKPVAPKESSYDPGMSIQLDIRSTDLVNKFMDMVLDHAKALGIRQTISNILEVAELYSKTKRIVRKELAKGKLETIPQLLYKQLIKKNMREITSKLIVAEADNLLDKINRSLPELQQAFLQQEQDWLSQSQHSEKVIDSWYLNKVDRANINTLRQAVTSMHRSEQLPQKYLSTMHNLSNNTNITT